MMKQIIAAIFLFAFVAQIDAFPKRARDDSFQMETFAANCSLNATTANCSHQLNNVRTLPSQSSAVKLVKMSAFVAISLVALLGNVFVVMIICRNKSLRKTVNLFILNMAISDLFAPVIAVPMHLYSLHVNAITATFAWPFEGLIGNISCKVAMFLVDSSPVISILSLVLMSGDRFYAVVFPLKAPRVRYKIRVALLVCSWIVAFSYFSPYFEIVSLQYIFGQPSCVLYWPPPYDHAKSMQIYSTIMCVFFTIIPFVLLSVMYSVMLWILRKKKIARHHIRSASSRRQRNNRNIVFMALAIVVVFAICWGPYN
ncbi:hypothetical protein QZH41_015288, partial [Actinostola sp. cb2023]